MNRPAARLLFLFVSAALLAGFSLPAVRADGPALTAKFGIAGRYKPGGWCLVTVGVTNPGPDTLSGQLQVVAANTDNGSSPFGRRGGRANTPSAVFACPVSVPGGTTSPRTFPLYVRGVDPGQADLTVQLVEGRERGDGRVLAKISNQNPNQAAAFSGSPVTPRDTLLVGFGGDPGAFLFLNGRSLGAGTVQNGMPATEQVAEASASDLPDKAAGYGGVSAFLLRSDAPLDALTEAQADALKAWVASGGHLVVCGGSDPTRFAAPFFEGLLPAAVGPAGAGGALTLTPKQTPGVRVVQAAPFNSPRIVAGPYGAGTVTLTAFDPTPPVYPMLGPMALPPVWQTIFREMPDYSSSVLTITGQREENTNAFYFGNTPPLLSEAVMRGPSLDAPGTSVIALFLLAYLVILVPVNYLVLKRLDRKEWAWGTIPALVLLFAAATFAVGYAAKGGSVFVNRAALIETNAGCRNAGVYSEVGLFSPRRSSYDIDLAGDGLVSAIPNPGTDYSGRGNPLDAGTAQFVETPAGVSLPATPVNMWAMRAFDTQSATDLGGAIDASLSGRTGLTGTIVNRTPYPLTDCAVYFQGRWLLLGSLAPGATWAVPGTSLSRVQTGEFSLPLSPTPAGSEIHARMQASLAGYFRSLGERQPNYNGMNTRLSYMPSNNEALFAGWSRDPKLAGPAPRIDGQAVTENDETLVVVHVPISGAPAPVALVPPSTPYLGYQFAAISKSSPLFRRALTASALETGPASQVTGRPVWILGIVTAVQHNPALSPRPVLMLTQGGVPVTVQFSTGINDRAIHGLSAQEILIQGVLMHPSAVTGYAKEFVISQPGQLRIVH